MCNSKCKHPELKPAEGKCSENQIKECHGDEKKDEKKEKNRIERN